MILAPFRAPLRLSLAALILSSMTFGAPASEGDVVPRGYTEKIAVDTGEVFTLELVPIPGGSFQMGSPEDEEGRAETEGPRRKVSLAPFYMSTTEIPFGLFLEFYRETKSERDDYMPASVSDDVDSISGPTPVYGDIRMGASLDTPAIGMTWHNAVTFTRWLSKKTGKKYRLPTEAEWEYACRSGTSNRFGATDDPDELVEYAWFDDNAPRRATNEVGTRKPNPWGLYDMSGNVSEWVHDFYRPNAYAEALEQGDNQNPKGPETGKVHVARGGDFTGFPEDLRCSARSYEKPYWRAGDPQLPKSIWWLPNLNTIGFRVVRSAESQ